MKKNIFFNKLNIFAGVHDVFSTIISKNFNFNIFCSGYSFTASYFGKNDNGHMKCQDMVRFVKRIRDIDKKSIILSDIDDGFGGKSIALNTILELEKAGANIVMIEDQQRPKMCGHLKGKKVVPLKKHLKKLNYIQKNKKKMIVLARTDEINFLKALERVKAFKDLGCECLMVEGINNLKKIEQLLKISDGTPIAVNIINGGRTNSQFNFKNLEQMGVKILLLSTPTLFAAQYGIESFYKKFIKNNGVFEKSDINLKKNIKLLN